MDVRMFGLIFFAGIKSGLLISMFMLWRINLTSLLPLFACLFIGSALIMLAFLISISRKPVISGI